MKTLLQVALLGNPILRKKAKKVNRLDNQAEQKLIDNMIFTMMDVEGLGIAAPQVYQSKRLFIVGSHPNSRYPNAPIMKPKAFINPEITKFSKENEDDWEGCLSIPGVRGLVSRPVKIKTKFKNRKGETKTQEFKGMIARIFQHELDHLNGVVFLDKVKSTKHIMLEKEWRKRILKK